MHTDETSHIREHECATFALEQMLPERILQQLELRADRRLRDPQLLRPPRDTSGVHYGRLMTQAARRVDRWW